MIITKSSLEREYSVADNVVLITRYTVRAYNGRAQTFVSINKLYNYYNQPKVTTTVLFFYFFCLIMTCDVCVYIFLNGKY